MMCKLSDICEFVKGKVAVSNLTKTNYISTENMLPNRGGIVEAATLPSVDTTQTYTNGDILVSNIRPYFKKIWFATTSGGCSNDVLVFRAKKDVNPFYLYYILSDDRFFNYATATSKGTKMPRGDKIAIMNYEIEKHSRFEQDVIASILRPMDEKIALNREINNNLFEQAIALLNLTFPNSHIGNKCIGDYITPKRGKNLLSKDAIKGDVPVVAGGLEPATYHNVANTIPPVLAISASGANSGYVSLWSIPIWSSDSSFIDSNMTNEVYFWYVLLKKRQSEIYEAQTGSAQPHIYPQHIAAMPLIELDMQKVRCFNDTVTPNFKAIGENLKQNNRLSAIRDAILPKLMSGELDVSELEI